MAALVDATPKRSPVANALVQSFAASAGTRLSAADVDSLLADEPRQPSLLSVATDSLCSNLRRNALSVCSNVGARALSVAALLGSATAAAGAPIASAGTAVNNKTGLHVVVDGVDASANYTSSAAVPANYCPDDSPWHDLSWRDRLVRLCEDGLPEDPNMLASARKRLAEIFGENADIVLPRYRPDGVALDEASALHTNVNNVTLTNLLDSGYMPEIRFGRDQFLDIGKLAVCNKEQSRCVEMPGKFGEEEPHWIERSLRSLSLPYYIMIGGFALCVLFLLPCALATQSASKRRAERERIEAELAALRPPRPQPTFVDGVENDLMVLVDEETSPSAEYYAYDTEEDSCDSLSSIDVILRRATLRHVMRH